MLPILFIPAFEIAYVFFVLSTPLFFGYARSTLSSVTWRSFLIIVGASFGVFVVVNVLGDENFGWANRVLHALGGGAMAMLVCYRAMKDAHLKISRFQFVALSLLLATAMGVANELMEFSIQTTAGIIFAPNTMDTWLDLTSNTVGMVVAGTIAWFFWE